MAFAGALVRAGADVHRGDARGLSALFWAQALRGCDTAAALAARQRKGAQPAMWHGARCKDGVLRVEAGAWAWMETNFPPVAAAAVTCATLALTLRAQGFQAESADSES